MGFVPLPDETYRALVGRGAPPSTVNPSPRTVNKDERARELLLALLNDNQRATFVLNGWFDIEPGRSFYTYRSVRVGHCKNCHQTHVKDWCVHPRWWAKRPERYGSTVVETSVPRDDDLITMLMWVSGDPRHFFNTAQRYASNTCCLV